MPFNPHELGGLEDGWEPEDEENELDDERAGDASTWDLNSGRAAAHQPGRVSVSDIDVAALIDLVCDGVHPDGTAATEETRVAALVAWQDKDPRLVSRLLIAVTGHTPEGKPVDLKTRDKAIRYVERRRRRWLESGDLFAPPAGASAHGRKPSGKHALRVTEADGSVRLEHLGNDDQAIAEAATHLSGVSLDDLRAPFKQGPQSDQERARRARQALTIVRLLELGATQRAVGRVFGLAPERVSERADLGRQLAERLSPGNPNI